MEQSTCRATSPPFRHSHWAWGTSPAFPHDPRTGREEDQQTLTAALHSGQALAVVGMGGLGKSSLAAEVIYALAADPAAFPSGVEGLTWILDQLLAVWEATLPAEATARVTSLEEGLQLCEHNLPLARLLDTLAPLGIVTLLTSRRRSAGCTGELQASQDERDEPSDHLAERNDRRSRFLEPLYGRGQDMGQLHRREVCFCLSVHQWVKDIRENLFEVSKSLHRNFGSEFIPTLEDILRIW
jgi:hypothetical protein